MKRNQIERIKAYETCEKLKQNGFSNKEIINQVIKEYSIPAGTIYDWLKYNKSPFGKRKIKYNDSLFYVLGSLLGDGCAYYWKKRDKYMVHLVGEKEFIEKYSDKLANCTGKKIKGYIDRNKNIWNHKTWNIELYQLLKKAREKKEIIINLLNKGDYYNNSIQIIEGFFDAEGCVKIINEKIRKTPKICLDITNVDFELLEIIKRLLMDSLKIEARYSIQKAGISKNGTKHQKAYHLRIYKKEHIRKFFENIKTIKLKSEKIEYLNNWLNNGK